VSFLKKLTKAEMHVFILFQANELQISTKVFSRRVLGPAAEDSKDRLLYEENGGPEWFVDISKTKDGAYLTVNANSRNSSEVRGSSET
jgi:protease II